MRHSPETTMAAALEGRTFGAGNGATVHKLPAAAAPAPYVRRTVRAEEIHLGHASNGDEIGIHLGKLIEGRLLIQGNSGAGKSMLLRRLFEQTFGRVQQLLVDCDGEFSTLAEKFDVAVVTSAEIARIGARTFAQHVREHRYSAVLDLSDATAEERMAMIAELASALVEAPAEHWHPLLVLIDEVQVLAPRYDPGDVEPETRQRARAALADMMGRGRKRGIAGVIATQRIAETATAVCAKATNVIVGRTIFDRDLERSGALLGFTVGHSRTLRTLADGEFLALGPAIAGPSRVRFKAGSVQSRHKGDAPAIAAPPSVSAAQSLALLREVPDETPGDVEASAPRDRARARKPGGRPSTWSVGEDAIIRDAYKRDVRIVDIIEALVAAGFRKRQPGSVSMRAQLLGCSSPRAASGWSEEEHQILREGHADPDCKMIDIVARLAGAGYERGRAAVQMKAIQLGLTRDRVNYWTDDEKRIAIAGLEAGKTNRDIIEDLRQAGFERGVTSVSKFAQKHNFCRKGESWTPDDTELLKQLYAKRMPVREISERLGKTQSAIAARASKLGLRQRTAWTEQERELLAKCQRRGDTLVKAASLIGRPYPNVAAEASRMHLNFRNNKKRARK